MVVRHCHLAPGDADQRPPYRPFTPVCWLLLIVCESVTLTLPSSRVFSITPLDLQTKCSRSRMALAISSRRSGLVHVPSLLTQSEPSRRRPALRSGGGQDVIGDLDSRAHDRSELHRHFAFIEWTAETNQQSNKVWRLVTVALNVYCASRNMSMSTWPSRDDVPSSHHMYM